MSNQKLGKPLKKYHVMGSHHNA